MSDPVDEDFDPDATISIWHTADVTSEIAPRSGDASDSSNGGDSVASAEAAPSGYWQPGTRLSSRVSTPVATPRSVETRAWWIAGLIIIVALLVAVALWLVALRIQSGDNDSDDGSGQSSSSVPASIFRMI